MGYLFVLSCIANIAWLFCWHYNQFALSVVVMLALLGLLIAIYLRLEIGLKPVSTAEKWAVNIPFSVYLGWITVATIANITDLLYYIGWNGWGLSPEIWTVIMLAAAVVITALMLLRRGDIAYALVIVWALLGITVKQLSNGTVAVASLVANAIVLALIIFTLVRKGKIDRRGGARSEAGRPVGAGQENTSQSGAVRGLNAPPLWDSMICPEPATLIRSH